MSYHPTTNCFDMSLDRSLDTHIEMLSKRNTENDTGSNVSQLKFNAMDGPLSFNGKVFPIVEESQRTACF